MHNTHKMEDLRELHAALLEIVGIMNLPQRDEALLKEAGVNIDRALFPILAVVQRFGPIGVVELADRVGRDYTTVSRQIGKLEKLDLVLRRNGTQDKRVKEVILARGGLEVCKSIDAARERLASDIFSDWSQQETEELSRLMRKFADALKVSKP